MGRNGTVRRDGEEIVDRNNDIFYYTANSTSQHGVGFLVAKKWKNNIKEYISYSDRLAVLKIHITNKKSFTIVHAYRPTTSHTVEEIEDFYDLLNKACDEQRGTWTVVLGDFNATIGPRLDSDNSNVLGPYGLGTRHQCGTRFLQFAFGQTMRICNSYLQ